MWRKYVCGSPSCQLAAKLSLPKLGLSSSFELWLCKLFPIGALLFTLLCWFTNYHLPRDATALGSVNIGSRGMVTLIRLRPYEKYSDFVFCGNPSFELCALLFPHRHGGVGRIERKDSERVLPRAVPKKEQGRDLPRCNRLFIYISAYLWYSTS